MRQSKYEYPGTDVLINLPGIRDAEELKRFERTVTKERLSQLEQNPIRGSFDLEHLKKIHRFIFQDVYPFAGEIRTETIAKDYFTFAPAQFIVPAANDLFRQLKQEKYLKGLPLEEFADRAAFYMAEINVLHPFREGNGRTQREFIRELSVHAGYDLDWFRVDPDQLLKASIRSKVDPKDLSDIIQHAIKGSVLEAEPLLLKDLIMQVDGMPSFWNNLKLDAEMLNREVSQYAVKKYGKGHMISVQLKGCSEQLNIQMDPVPHFNRQIKAQLIEQAAKGIHRFEADRSLDISD